MSKYRLNIVEQMKKRILKVFIGNESCNLLHVLKKGNVKGCKRNLKNLDRCLK